MKFTGDDLKRLKEQVDGLADARPSWQVEAADICNQLPALFARLEAAERVIQAHIDLEAERTSYDNFVGFLNLWRKIAGKE